MRPRGAWAGAFSISPLLRPQARGQRPRAVKQSHSSLLIPIQKKNTCGLTSYFPLINPIYLANKQETFYNNYIGEN